MSEGRALIVDCLSIVRPVGRVTQVDDSVMQEIASEREACEEKILDILRKVR